MPRRINQHRDQVINSLTPEQQAQYADQIARYNAHRDSDVFDRFGRDDASPVKTAVVDRPGPFGNNIELRGGQEQGGLVDVIDNANPRRCGLDDSAKGGDLEQIVGTFEGMNGSEIRQAMDAMTAEQVADLLHDIRPGLGEWFFG